MILNGVNDETRINNHDGKCSVFFARGKGKAEDDYAEEGMCVGMCLGLMLGSLADSSNSGLGASLGMLFGLVIGLCMHKKGK